MGIQTFIDAVTGKTRKKQIKEIEDKVSGKPKKSKDDEEEEKKEGMNMGGMVGYKKGGKVRGCGIATQGVRKAKGSY